MEDEKLAAYYDDLTRRGGGAARFKQGLGFSSNGKDDDVPSRGSALSTSSSFLSSFVKASSPSKTSEFEKQAELQSIQNKLCKKPKEKIRSPSRDSSRRSRSPSGDRIRDKHSKRRGSRSHSRDRYSRRRSRSPSRDRIRDKRSKHRSRSRSRDRHSRRRSRSRDRRSKKRSRSSEKNRETSRRQLSPEKRTSDKSKKPREVPGCGGVDFAKLIHGYDNMTPAERVKAKMKLQLSNTAENDEAIGKGSGWERFEFNKDAPLDDEEEIEAAEDDTELVKHIGQSFRFSAVEARKEKDMKAVHDEAMFGAPSSYPAPAESDDEAEENKILKNGNIESGRITSLLSDQVLTMQKGSWRDRARKP
ncbi:hypothetical protein ACS0TY_034670 [Phlomoides rotata]